MYIASAKQKNQIFIKEKNRMKTHEIARGGSLFTYSEGNGNYSFENGVFQLKDLAPALYMNGKKVPFGKWKIVKAAENSLSAKADGKSGSWDFKAAVDKDGKLVLGMTGHLKEACEDIAVYYFEDLCIPADHLATQGRGTGDSDLYPLTGKNVKKNDFHGATVITITKKENTNIDIIIENQRKIHSIFDQFVF